MNDEARFAALLIEMVEIISSSDRAIAEQLVDLAVEKLGDEVRDGESIVSAMGRVL